MTATAVIDRLVHHGFVFVFKSESHRLRTVRSPTRTAKAPAGVQKLNPATGSIFNPVTISAPRDAFLLVYGAAIDDAKSAASPTKPPSMLEQFVRNLIVSARAEKARQCELDDERSGYPVLES